MAQYDVAAYIWPAYTGDEPRTRMFWPEGYGEWQTVKMAKAKFDGHEWPRKPLWGYVNEADPYVMQMQIDAAADHGVNTFIYDWYWYDRRPFLEQCLNDGFLKAKNNNRMKFYLMWANHDAGTLWDYRLSSGPDTIIWDSGVDMDEFKRLAKRIIDKYFHLDNYYKIDNMPVFSIYNIPKLVSGLGGVDNTKKALTWFKEEAIRQGFAGVHLQMIIWNDRESNIKDDDGTIVVPFEKLTSALGFDSMTHYQYVHFVDINRSYPAIMDDVIVEWSRLSNLAERTGAAYFPHVSVGWDTNPRFLDLKHGIMKDTSPKNIEDAMRHAMSYVDAHPGQAPLIVINSWNEWTETSYLQPDDRNGYGYLQAIKRALSTPQAR